MQNSSAAFHEEWIIEVTDPQQRDILIAQLSELGFDGFEEIPGNLAAYGSVDSIRKSEVEDLLTVAGVGYRKQIIQPQNWNAIWESSFEPVVIGQFCRIHAHFHPAETGYAHQISITPKMSFGTGHHATTRMMILMMEGLAFSGKKVLDFGAGTGVLAILAEKLGAAAVLAIENDPGAVENARENVAVNACQQVEVREGSLETAQNQTFDIVLANINRNILVSHAAALAKSVAAGGVLVLSGILAEDVSLLQEAFEKENFSYCQKLHEGNWACLRFTKNNNPLISTPLQS